MNYFDYLLHVQKSKLLLLLVYKSKLVNLLYSSYLP